ncbi:MAG: recombinase family protein [Oscillospiraceae bacterium]
MERGVVFGQSLLGYDVKNGKLTVEPEGAALVRLIFHKYGVEKKGTSVIARELQEAGYRTYSGNVKWSTSQIVKMLKNEKYVGDLVQKKTITPDYLTHAKKYNHGEEEMIVIKSHHEPIIDRDLWNLVQSELKQRNRHGKPDTGHSNRYGLSGKIQCGACGATFVSRKKNANRAATIHTGAAPTPRHTADGIWMPREIGLDATWGGAYPTRWPWIW